MFYKLFYSRVHTLGHASSNTHPDSRAIMFENDTYSKRKIESFLSLLTGFHKCLDVLALFSHHADSIK